MSPEAPELEPSELAPQSILTAPQLLHFLQARSGQEFRAVTVRQELWGKGKAQKSVWVAVSPYLLTVRQTGRGAVVEATGPSEQPRQLSPERFLEVFGGSHFGPAEATGKMTDLGPLFGG